MKKNTYLFLIKLEMTNKVCKKSSITLEACTNVFNDFR